MLRRTVDSSQMTVTMEKVVMTQVTMIHLPVRIQVEANQERKVPDQLSHPAQRGRDLIVLSRIKDIERSSLV